MPKGHGGPSLQFPPWLPIPLPPVATIPDPLHAWLPPPLTTIPDAETDQVEMTWAK